MDKEHFTKLAVNEKANIVFSEGKYLAVRYYYGFAVNLYLLDDYYIEVFYHSAINKIDRIEALDDLKKPELYIDYMNRLDSLSRP